MNKLYAYALAQKKPVYMQDFKIIAAMVGEFRFFKKEDEHGQSVKIIFTCTCISYLV